MTPEIAVIIVLGSGAAWLLLSVVWMGRVFARKGSEEYWYDWFLLLPVLGLIYMVVPPVMLVQKLKERKNWKRGKRGTD